MHVAVLLPQNIRTKDQNDHVMVISSQGFLCTEWQTWWPTLDDAFNKWMGDEKSPSLLLSFNE